VLDKWKKGTELERKEGRGNEVGLHEKNRKGGGSGTCEVHMREIK